MCLPLPLSSSFMFLCYRHDLLKPIFDLLGMHLFTHCIISLGSDLHCCFREKKILAVDNVIHVTTYCIAYNLGTCKAKGL